MSLVRPQPAAFAFREVPDIDLEGGQLIDIDQHEELDTDGWRQQVFTYRILAADGRSEVTKTIRRKVKLDCTSMFRRYQVTNGVEAAVEEKCERVMGDIRGLGPVQSLQNNQNLFLDPNDKQDMAIANVLNQVPETFKSLLSKEHDFFVKEFPQLFSQLRTKSKLVPTNNYEVITNPDGSTTTRTKSSKSFSQSFSSQETYINGIKQEQMSKQRFRAFVEYKGPEYGFKVKLSDNTDELSEDEAEEIDDDKVSRTHSELTDTESEIYLPSKALTEKSKRLEKARLAAEELVDSEKRYVDKLQLLSERFCQRVQDEKVLDKQNQVRLFANLPSLFTFHDKHLLPQLMEAFRDWNTTHRIANVMRRQAPFLKMYSEYTNNYERATKMFEDAKKKKRFAEIVHEIEKQEECGGLPLAHHLICPVQRVMRYQLLLQEYKRHLVDTDADFADAKVALELVLAAAAHANQMMKKMDGFRQVIEVQEQLGNSVSLVHPGRELLKQANIQKISSSTEKPEDRVLFLFSDCIILAGKRTIIALGMYKMRAFFHAAHTQVCEGDNLEQENSFYLRGSDGKGPHRCVELLAESREEKREWMERLCAVIDDAKLISASFGGESQRSSFNDKNNTTAKNCANCDVEFSLWSRGVKCCKCNTKLCKKCFGRYSKESKNRRICEQCTKAGFENSRPQSMASERQNQLAVSATAEGIIHSGRVNFRGPVGKTTERLFVVRKDYCLYSYENATDEEALAMVPLPGCEVRMNAEPCAFNLRVGSREYCIKVENEHERARWMALMDLACNANVQS